MNKIYYIICDICGNTIESIYSQDDLIKEFMNKYPDDTEENIIICDDCFNIIQEDVITLH